MKMKYKYTNNFLLKQKELLLFEITNEQALHIRRLLISLSESTIDKENLEYVLECLKVIKDTKMTDKELQEIRKASFAKVSNTIAEYSANAINHDKAIFRYGFDCAIELMREENRKLREALKKASGYFMEKDDMKLISNLLKESSET
jgi:hypothetical protein